MWQKAVVTCALVLFNAKLYAIQSVDHNFNGTFPMILEASGNETVERVKLKSNESEKSDNISSIVWQKLHHKRKRKKRIISENKEALSNQTNGANGKFYTNVTESINTTMMMISDTKNSSITPMGKMLIAMSVTTTLTIIVTFVLTIYITEKRLFVERQIAMQKIPTG
uniref:Uncharacterized protein n=1 Tax=Wuchereria bancrofti TaxID=6293 RepID=A0AAF5PRA4_WUCBA